MKEKRNSREMVAIGLLIISLVLITAGTSFAFFNYSRQGTTENKIQTGNLTFVYDEQKEKDGNSISLTNAFPISDTDGQTMKASQNYFDFEIRAKTQGAAINYEVYLTKEESSNLDEKVVKTYLTTLGDVDSETAVTTTPTSEALNLYSELYDSKVPETSNAKTLYRETIADSNPDYKKDFRFRMWLSDKATEVSDDGAWQYNGKTFSVKVNVYAQNDKITDPVAPAGA